MRRFVRYGRFTMLTLGLLTVTGLVMAAGLVSVPAVDAAPSAMVAAADATPAAVAPGGTPSGTVALATASAFDPVVGDTATFWAMDEGPTPAVPVQLQATAKYVGDKCVIYVDPHSPVNQTVLNNLGVAFDDTIYPRVTSVLGPAPLPGIDGTSKITILIYDFRDLTTSGLFRPADVDPGSSETPSNRREMIYLNSTIVSAEPDNAPALAAHEFAHLIVYYHDYMLDPSPGRALEALWVDEGIACYAEHAAGYDGRTNSLLMSFESDSNVDLTRWTGDRSNYGASYSFISYLVGREGQDFVTALVAEHADGIAGINAVLGARGSFDTFDSLIDDWVVADFLDGQPPSVPRFSIPDLTVSARPLTQGGQYPCIGTGRVTNFGALYLDFPSASRDLTFSAVLDGDDGAPLHAALISWDSAGVLTPQVQWFVLTPATTSGTLVAPNGYDRHTLAIWARGEAGADALYGFRYSGAVNPPAGTQFLDLSGDDEFYPFISGLLVRHVISGMEIPAGSNLWFFMGQSAVNRAEFAKMTMEATGLHTAAIDHLGSPTFKDVRLTYTSGAPDPYPYDYIEEAVSNGIVSGYGNGRFGPGDLITRGQLALMIGRGATAAGKPFPTYTGHDTVFADVTPASPYYQNVMKAYKAGIFGGSKGADGRLYYSPWLFATRNQVAKMTYNLMQYLESSGS